MLLRLVQYRTSNHCKYVPQLFLSFRQRYAKTERKGLTATDGASNKSKCIQLTGIDIRISIRCNDLGKDVAQGDAETHIQTMNQKEDPKVLALQKCLDTVRKRRFFAGSCSHNTRWCRWSFWNDKECYERGQGNAKNDQQLKEQCSAFVTDELIVYYVTRFNIPFLESGRMSWLLQES